MHIFEDLKIWQNAQALAVDVYLHFKDNKDWGFRDQIQRAVIPISNNIAEGSEYNSDKYFIHYLKIAKGSCGEVRNMFYLCPQIGYCSQEEAKDYIERCKALGKSIGAFIAFLENGQK